MTKCEIERYFKVGRLKSVCVDISVPDRYPGWVRLIRLRRPTFVRIEYDPHRTRHCGIYCEAAFENLDCAIASIERFLSAPLRDWQNCTATDSYPKLTGDHEEGTRAIVIDLLTSQLSLPEGAEFDITTNGWEHAYGYWQPRVMRHVRPGMSPEFAIHDVFFDAIGRIVSFTQHARSDRAHSVKALRELILSQIPEAQTGIKCGDLGYKHTAEWHHEHWLEYIDDEVLEYGEEPAHIKIT